MFFVTSTQKKIHFRFGFFEITLHLSKNFYLTDISHTIKFLRMKIVEPYAKNRKMFSKKEQS